MHNVHIIYLQCSESNSDWKQQMHFRIKLIAFTYVATDSDSTICELSYHIYDKN